MTKSDHITQPRIVVLAGAFAGVLALAVLYGVGILRSPLGFEYPLDDVYIHLAMAEQIAAGGYGVNSGEFASAASSPLYPLLLTPFAGTEMQRWLPLFWNVVSIATASAIFASILVTAGFGRFALVAAISAPVGLNMYVVAYTGMENMAHGATSLMIVLGLWRWIEVRRLGWLLILGVFLSPALRLEGLALALAASGVVIFTGNRIGGLALAGLAILPVAIFVFFLTSLGLDPLPNSVVAKLSDSAVSEHSRVIGVLTKFLANIATKGGLLLFLLSVALGLAALSLRGKSPQRALFAGAIAVSCLAHLALGSIGWMDRYEIYAVLAAVAALLLVMQGQSKKSKSLILVASFVGGLLTYFPPVAGAYSWNVAAIRLQQGEMARFVKDFADVPVAVNDLGYVSWRNPNYVLDLWGLASSEALRTRLSNPPSGWAGPLAAKHNVQLVMIYDRWLGDAVPPDWVPLGTLHLLVPRSFIGGYEVRFFATSDDVARTLKPQLEAWAIDLPDMTEFRGEPRQ